MTEKNVSTILDGVPPVVGKSVNGEVGTIMPEGTVVRGERQENPGGNVTTIYRLNNVPKPDTLTGEVFVQGQMIASFNTDKKGILAVKGIVPGCTVSSGMIMHDNQLVLKWTAEPKDHYLMLTYYI